VPNWRLVPPGSVLRPRQQAPAAFAATAFGHLRISRADRLRHSGERDRKSDQNHPRFHVCGIEGVEQK
jgi:hypothetical protein